MSNQNFAAIAIAVTMMFPAFHVAAQESEPLETSADATSSPENVIMVLDGSGSMWGQIDGTAKIEIAREAIDKMLKDWSKTANLGLVAYGHRREGDCQDIETLLPTGPLNPQSFMTTVNGINPKGKTPITASVRQAAEALRYKDEKATVILISDGLENCNADPCALASELEQGGVDFTTHVIGFDISQDESQQLACLAENTGGQFIRASNAAELSTAVAQTAQVIAEAEPEPFVWFEDNFDGDRLSDDWAVMNPNPDAYIVENGTLLTIASEDHAEGLLKNETMSNIFQLERELPEGDWTATIRFNPKIQTVREVMFLSLYTDPENYLVGEIGLLTTWGKSTTTLKAKKVSGGTVSEFSQPALPALNIPGTTILGDTPRWLGYYEDNVQELYLRISKSGRSYIVSSKIVGALTTADGAEPQWTEIQKLTSLRAPGNKIVFGSYFSPPDDYDIVGGESLIPIDWIKIETPEEPATSATSPPSPETNAAEESDEAIEGDDISE